MPAWSRRFDEPIPLPDGKTLITLKQAAAYIIALPKSIRKPRKCSIRHTRTRIGASGS
jgi:hypothetical protein